MTNELMTFTKRNLNNGMSNMLSKQVTKIWVPNLAFCKWFFQINMFSIPCKHSKMWKHKWQRTGYSTNHFSINHIITCSVWVVQSMGLIMYNLPGVMSIRVCNLWDNGRLGWGYWLVKLQSESEKMDGAEEHFWAFQEQVTICNTTLIAIQVHNPCPKKNQSSQDSRQEMMKIIDLVEIATHR